MKNCSLKTGEQRFRGQQRKDRGKTGNAHETRRCSALTPGRARSHCARSHRAINTRETCTLRVTKARDWAHMPARLGAHACSCRSTRNRVPGDDLPGGGCRLARALVVHGPRWHCATWCAQWRRHVKECSDDLAAGSEQVQDLCCGLRNVNPLACRYRHDHPPATSLASITNSWQHGAAQRVPCLSMEGSRCAKGLVYSLSLNR